MSLPDVDTARARMLSELGPLEAETVDLLRADGRRLAAPITASRDQPPFDASAMDGWAVGTGDARPGRSLAIVGESSAGHDAEVHLAPGEAVRIFTGAPLPAGADRVVIQEEATRDGDRVTLGAISDGLTYVRPRGGDFRTGTVLLQPGLRLDPWRIALAASAGVAVAACRRRPRVALLSTGDELAALGEIAGPHQIYDACGPALAAFVRRQDAEPILMAVARDDDASILASVASAPFDLLVTIGGASVGDHDRVKPALRSAGAVLSVEGVAVRPGKPVWFGHLGDGRPVLGLPGNPASALVCAELFLAPLLAVLQGGESEPVWGRAVLETPLPANGPREHYMRAVARTDADGVRRVRAAIDQDSSLVTVMAAANALVRRRPWAEALDTGMDLEILQRHL